ncbi:hypothetical protein I553_4909 [Mycobacterium xenopi 4042]|uniref:Uncharacterized protein n=1 Tax=Mycobacterium xenopi 4042 TaxID=1299334 RepID=X8AFG3_MYCXE|nr:hypothetical protein I553_4909 [Mycobacterium xenopi 4042]
MLSLITNRLAVLLARAGSRPRPPKATRSARSVWSSTTCDSCSPQRACCGPHHHRNSQPGVI